MSYRIESSWNGRNEIRCLLICKKLIVQNFPRGKQKESSLEMAQETKLTWGSISAKISNYKTLFGINELSNYSKNSKIIYEKYKDYSISELEKIVQ